MIHGHLDDISFNNAPRKLQPGFISTILVLAKSRNAASDIAKKKLKHRYFRLGYNKKIGNSTILEIDEIIHISLSKFLFNRFFNLPLIGTFVPSIPHCNFIFYSE